MVISEKGLLHAMKDAYKADGYTVAVDDSGGGEDLVLLTPIWTVVIQKNEVPGKILGLITEHLRKLPKPGEAYRVKKKETQTEIYNMVMGTVEDFRTEEKKRQNIRRTNLTMDSFRLWQAAETKTVVKVFPDYEDILRLESFGVMTGIRLVGEDVLLADDMVSRAYIRCARPKEASQLEQLAHLEKFQWTAE